VATFVQALTKMDAGERKRVYVIYGPSDHLRTEMRDRIRRVTAYREGDRRALDARDNVWLEASTYPQSPESERLIEVRGAEHFGTAEWEQANAFLDARDIPQVRVVLDLATPDLPDNAELRRLVKRSACKQVRCSPMNEADAVEWIRSFAPMLTKNQAWRVLERTGDELDARDAARAISLVAGTRLDISDAVVESLAQRKTQGEFSSALLSGDKANAIRLIPEVSAEDHTLVIGLLDAQVEVARCLREVQQVETTGRAIAELARTSGMPINLVRDVAHVARHYTDTRARRATSALAVADAASRSGARTGVLEALVALW